MGVSSTSRYLSQNMHLNVFFDVLRLTQPEEEHKETWRSIDEERKTAFKNGPFSQWSLGAGEMVKTATKIIKVRSESITLMLFALLIRVMKYGLYDRPELKTWYKGRVVLLGDAAHPTTPVSTSFINPLSHCAL